MLPILNNLVLLVMWVLQLALFTGFKGSTFMWSEEEVEEDLVLSIKVVRV